MTLRTLLKTLGLAVMVSLGSSGALHAAEAAYPARNITFILPYTAGGSSDVLTRAVAKLLGEAWGRNIIVDNRPGASGMIGAEVVAKAPPDGYLLLSTTSSYPGT